MDKKHMVNYFEQILYPIKSMFNTVVDRELLVNFVKETYCLVTNKRVFLYIPQLENSNSKLPAYIIMFINNNPQVTITNKIENVLTKEEYQKHLNQIFSFDEKKMNEEYNKLKTKEYFITKTDEVSLKKKVFSEYFVFSIDEADSYIYDLFVLCKEELYNHVADLHNTQNTLIRKDEKKIYYFYQFCYHVLKSISNEPIAIPLISLYYSKPIVYTQYKDAKQFVNNFIQHKSTYGYDDTPYYKQYKTNHFFLWLFFRNEIFETYNSNKIERFFRLKEAAFFGISNYKVLDNETDLFKTSIDIFSILNFCIANESLEQKIIPIYQNRTKNNTKASFLTSSLEYLITDKDGIVLDTKTNAEIIDLYVKFLNKKMQEVLGDKYSFNMSNIFATNNPNQVKIWRGVRLYNNKIKSRDVLLLINVNENIQLRFNQFMSDHKSRYVVVMYSNSILHNKNYIINCMDMPYDNKDKIIFLWYNTKTNELVNLSTSYYAVNKGDNGEIICNSIEFCNNKKELVYNDDLTGIFYPQDNRFHVKYYYNTFEFINYKPLLNQVANSFLTQDNAKKIYMKDKKYYSKAGISLLSIDTKENQINCTKVSNGSMKLYVHFNVNISEYILTYNLEDYLCYLYITDTDEIIIGKITYENVKDNQNVYRRQFVAFFEFNPINILSNLTCKLVFDLSLIKNIHTGKSDNIIAIELNSASVKKGEYHIEKIIDIKLLPAMHFVKKTVINDYSVDKKNNSLKTLTFYADIKSTNDGRNKKDISKNLLWFYTDNGKDGIKLLKESDKEYLLGNNILFNVPNEWSREKICSPANKSSAIKVFPIIITDDELISVNEQKILSDTLLENIKNRITEIDYINGKSVLITCNNIVNLIGVDIEQGSSINEISLTAKFDYPYSKQIKNTQWYFMVYDKSKNIFSEGMVIEPTLSNIISKSSRFDNLNLNNLEVNSLYKLDSIGETITFVYKEQLLFSELIFIATVASSSKIVSASYMFTQPITLKFDGEILQILGNKNNFYDPIQGYEARSGVAESQRNKTDGNKTEYVKEVAYPSVKSNNDDSNTVDNSSKFFYYDDSNTSKIPEGEYYIMANDIKTNPYNSTEALNTQGSKYMHIYPYYNLDFYNEELFNKTINTAHNTMEAVGHYNNFLTSYLIHGGTDYEDNYGIDLSSNITTFCNNLTTLVNDTYKDKLYKVYGKVPIKLIVEYGKYPIDLRGKSTPNGGIVEWISQFDGSKVYKAGDTACQRTCVEILKRSGLGDNSGNKVNVIVMGVEKGEDLKKEGTSKIVINGKKIEGIVYSTIDGEFDTNNQESYIKADNMKFIEGVKYIDQELEAGYPILVGVDHHYDRRIQGGVRYNAPKYTTDHFIVIVGRDSDANGFFYRFYEVGTGKYAFQGSKVNLELLNNTYRPNGIHDDNKLYVKNNILIGKTKYKPDCSYVVTEVRRNQHK